MQAIITVGVTFFLVGLPLGSDAACAAVEPPRVVELSPPDGADDVSPDTAELRVTFDRDMSTQGWSFCGGGPEFPAFRGRPSWVDARTVVVKVRLEPEHSYVMSLNCPAGQNFRSADGEPLAPVPWRFHTGSSRRPTDQREFNRRCVTELMDALRDEYSYYSYRKLDWSDLAERHREKLVDARDTRQWCERAGRMLAAAEDLHLWLEFGGQTFATARRRVQPNFNLDGVRARLPGLTQRNAAVWTARTDDDIAYVLITSWSAERKAELELDAVLAELADAKAIVIDVRPNAGGDELLARNVAGWFVEGEKVYGKNVYRSADSPSGLGPVLERKVTGYAAPKRFAGPVAVLMGRYNMSSCESFLLMMKQGRDCTLVGGRSYGSSGNPRPRLLENGVKVFIPSWKDLRPDGTCFEGEGIKPDVAVAATASQLRRGDPVLEKALTLLRRKTGGG